MNSSENSGRCPCGPWPSVTPRRLFATPMFMGRDFTRFVGGASDRKGIYDCLPTRPREMPKAPKNAPPEQDASEAGLAVTPDDVRAAAAAISSSVIVTECDQSRTLSEICGCK